MSTSRPNLLTIPLVLQENLPATLDAIQAEIDRLEKAIAAHRDSLHFHRALAAIGAAYGVPLPLAVAPVAPADPEPTPEKESA